MITISIFLSSAHQETTFYKHSTFQDSVLLTPAATAPEC
jgi:hypothetical protein